MKHAYLLLLLTILISACGSKSDTEMLIGTWEEVEFIYLADLTPVLPHDEFGYEGCVKTFDGKTVSAYNTWYGTPTEPSSNNYTIDENAKTLTIHAEDGDVVSDYQFADENTLYLFITIDNKKRKATYTRKLN